MNNQSPSIKHKLKFHNQYPITKRKKFGKLVMGVWLLFGYGCLVIGVSLVYALDLSKMKANFLKGNYQDVISEGEKLIAEQKGYRDGVDELYYLLGLGYLKKSNYLRASDIFEIIINEFKDSKFRDDAYVGLGDVAFLEGDFPQAEQRYRELLKINPSTKLASLLNFKLAQVLLKQGKWEEARQYADRLKQVFPLSMEAEMSQNLALDDFYFTVQVGSFSNQTNAETLCNKLLDKDFPAYIQEFTSGGKKIFRVRVGKLKTRLEAQDLEKILVSQGFPARIFP